MRSIKCRFIAVMVLLAGLSSPDLFAQPAATTPVQFVVAESGSVIYGDAFIVTLSDAAQIAHARRLVAEGAATAGQSILLAHIAPGADNVNRNWTAPDQPLWSWHIDAVTGFADLAIELCDGWPSYVETNVAGWIANTQGAICFWNYSVVAELPSAPGDPNASAEAVPVVDGFITSTALAALVALVGITALRSRRL